MSTIDPQKMDSTPEQKAAADANANVSADPRPSAGPASAASLANVEVAPATPEEKAAAAEAIRAKAAADEAVRVAKANAEAAAAAKLKRDAEKPHLEGVTLEEAARLVALEEMGLTKAGTHAAHFFTAQYSGWPPHMGESPLGAPLSEGVPFAHGSADPIGRVLTTEEKAAAKARADEKPASIPATPGEKARSVYVAQTLDGLYWRDYTVYCFALAIVLIEELKPPLRGVPVKITWQAA